MIETPPSFEERSMLTILNPFGGETGFESASRVSERQSMSMEFSFGHFPLLHPIFG